MRRILYEMHTEGFQLDLERGRLVPHDGGKAPSLRPQLVTLLTVLTAKPGELVTRDELQRALWGETEVDAEGGLNFCIRQLREILGDDAKNPRYVRTVPRRGYLWVAPLEETRTAGEPSARAAEASSLGGRIRRNIAIVVSALTLVPLVVVSTRPSPSPVPGDSASPPAVGHAVSGVVAAVQETALGSGHPVALEHRRALLEARWLARLGSEDRLLQAEELLRQILRQEPDWVLALEEMAYIRQRRATLGPETMGQTVARLEAALTSRDDVETRIALARVHFGSTWDFAAARRHLHRALELDPDRAETYRMLAMLETALGNHPRAVELAYLALELEPLESLWPGHMFLVVHFARQYDAALALAERALEIKPDDYSAWFVRVIASEKLGHFDDAAAAAARVLAFDDLPTQLPDDPRDAIRVFHRRRLDMRLATQQNTSWELADRALGHAYHGEADAAFAALDRALARRSLHVLAHLSNPRFDPIRHDPRWHELLLRLGLASHRGPPPPPPPPPRTIRSARHLLLEAVTAGPYGGPGPFGVGE